jgi:hypothetical protein
MKNHQIITHGCETASWPSNAAPPTDRVGVPLPNAGLYQITVRDFAAFGFVIRGRGSVLRPRRSTRALKPPGDHGSGKFLTLRRLEAHVRQVWRGEKGSPGACQFPRSVPRARRPCALSATAAAPHSRRVTKSSQATILVPACQSAPSGRPAIPAHPPILPEHPRQISAVAALPANGAK